MNIEAQILKKLGVSDCRVLKRFLSRRNEVFLISGRRPDGSEFYFVYKMYIYGDIVKEYSRLSELKGEHVPAVLARGCSALCLEYIKGYTLLEHLEEAERRKESFNAYIDRLLSFLQRFYELIPGQIYGDINLRNFISSENGIYGVDLEDTCAGLRETDIGRAAAFVLTYDPARTLYKEEVADYLIKSAVKSFNLDINEIKKQKEAELVAMHLRRGGDQ